MNVLYLIQGGALIIYGVVYVLYVIQICKLMGGFILWDMVQGSVVINTDYLRDITFGHLIQTYTIYMYYETDQVVFFLTVAFKVDNCD